MTSTARRHPIGIGTYDVFLLYAPSLRVRVPGHTAYEAWRNATTRLGCAGFCDCETALVSDAPPPARENAA